MTKRTNKYTVLLLPDNETYSREFRTDAHAESWVLDMIGWSCREGEWEPANWLDDTTCHRRTYYHGNTEVAYLYRQGL
jgi:hypothetical protein